MLAKHLAEQDLFSEEEWDNIDPVYQHTLNMETARNDIRNAELRRQVHRKDGENLIDKFLL